MTETIEQFVARVEAYEKEATPGPWHEAMAALPDGCEDMIDTHNGIEHTATGVLVVDYVAEPDSEFIAHSRADLPRALEIIREQQARIAELEKALTHAMSCCGIRGGYTCGYCDQLEKDYHYLMEAK